MAVDTQQVVQISLFIFLFAPTESCPINMTNVHPQKDSQVQTEVIMKKLFLLMTALL